MFSNLISWLLYCICATTAIHIIDEFRLHHLKFYLGRTNIVIIVGNLSKTARNFVRLIYFWTYLRFTIHLSVKYIVKSLLWDSFPFAPVTQETSVGMDYDRELQKATFNFSHWYSYKILLLVVQNCLSQLWIP